MNDKIQAILLRVVLELKKRHWSAAPEWEITLKSEGYIPLVKQIQVDGSLDGRDWKDVVETTLHLKFSSRDQITFFPEYSIYASMLLAGGENKDIMYDQDVDVALTEKDIKDDNKIKITANKIDQQSGDYINEEYNEYVLSNSENIKMYNRGGWKADNDARGDR